MAADHDTARPDHAGHAINAWSFGDLLLESHRYAPGPAGADVMHMHDTYQWCLSLDFPGQYRYRGARHAVPVGSLSLIHPGEAHAAQDPVDRHRAATFLVLYVPPQTVQEAAETILGRRLAVPFIADPIILDQTLAARFLAFHVATASSSTRLEPDARLLGLLGGLLRHAGVGGKPPRTRPERRAVALVRDYLDAHFADNPSLADLARLVDLSPYHVAHLFRDEVGLPPHAYLIGVRVDRAKALLVAGWPVARVATATGFFDQSHLTHHFKRIVGVPPGRYAAPRKNLQD